jgi:hypothetical protein
MATNGVRAMSDARMRIELPFTIKVRVDCSKLASQPSPLPSHALVLDVPVLDDSESNLSNWLRVRHNWQLEQFASAPIGRTAHDSRAVAVEMLAAADLLNKLGVLFDSIVYATTADIVPAGIFYDTQKRVHTATPEHCKQLLRLQSAVTTPTQFFVFEVTKIDFESPISLRAKVFGVGTLVLGSLYPLVDLADKVNGAFSLGHDGYEYVMHPHQEAKTAMKDAYLSQMKKERNSHNVRTVQNCLKLLGYNPGEIDGKNGPATQAAILEFARDHNLALGPNGRDDVLMEALSREAAAVAKISS